MEPLFCLSLFLTVLPSLGASATSSASQAGSEAFAQMRSRLQDDVGVANATEELIAVQGQVSSTLESLFVHHEEIEAANGKMRDDIGRLTMQIRELAGQLSHMQAGYVQAGQDFRQEELSLRGEVAKHAATVDGLAVELAKGSDLQARNDKLTEARERLLNESARASREGELAVHQLAHLRVAATQEVAHQGQLRDKLIEAHRDSLDCHSNAERREALLNAAKAAIPQESAAVAATDQHAKSAAQAGMQRLQAEAAILRQEIADAEADGGHALTALKQVQVQLKGVENSLVYQVRDLTNKMKATRDHNDAVATSISENHDAKKGVLTRKNNTQLRLSTLQQRVDPVTLATIEAENEAYGSELDDVIAQLRAAKSIESADVIGAQQAEAELKALQGSAEASASAIHEARLEGQKKLQEQLSITAAEKAKAAAVQKAARGALEQKCVAQWDARKTRTSEALRTCAQQRQELEVINAQRESLQQALQAQQAAQIAR